MPGMLSLDELKEAASGAIDTVVVAFADMAGQLIGKRFHVDFFLEGAQDETHACCYLLANDIDMEPVPGYKAASWSQGYGDFTLKPDMATLRRIPWLPATALVLADVVDHHHKDIPHSPRGLLKKQLARLEAMGMKAFSPPSWNSIYSTKATRRFIPRDTASRKRPAITSRITTSSRPPRKSR